MAIASMLIRALRLDTPYGTTGSADMTGITMVFLLVGLAVTVFYIFCYWRIFEKAGHAGWLAIIPLVNSIVLIKVAGHSGWWFLLLCIPFANIVFAIILMNDLSKAFGHGAGYTVGLIFLPWLFIPLLAFDGSAYVGAGAQSAVPSYAM